MEKQLKKLEKKLNIEIVYNTYTEVDVKHKDFLWSVKIKDTLFSIDIVSNISVKELLEFDKLSFEEIEFNLLNVIGKNENTVLEIEFERFTKWFNSNKDEIPLDLDLIDVMSYWHGFLNS